MIESNIYLEILKKTIIKKAINYCFTELKKYLQSINMELSISIKDFEHSYEILLNDAYNWSGIIKPFGFYNPKNTLDHYIELDFYITPQKSHYKYEKPEKELLNNIISKNTNSIILFGKPGMGKTTSMKMLTQKMITDENFLKTHFQIPFIIRLRELKDHFTDIEIKDDSKDLIFLFINKALNI